MGRAPQCAVWRFPKRRAWLDRPPLVGAKKKRRNRLNGTSKKQAGAQPATPNSARQLDLAVFFLSFLFFGMLRAVEGQKKP